MQNQSLQIQLNEVNRLLSIVPDDSNIQAHWGRYMCIVVAGFLENALQEVYKDYAVNAKNANLERYTSRQISRVTNPRAFRFAQVARDFSETWRSDLRDFLKRDGRKEAIDTIMRNRNSIAHGGQAVISTSDVKRYLEKAVEVIDFIENQCLGIPQLNP